jgi:hypothetical protein
MSPSNHSRTSRFVMFAALAALTGCGAEASTSLEASASAATFEQASIDHGHELRAPSRDALTVSRSEVRRASSSPALEGFGPTPALSSQEAAAIELGRAVIHAPSLPNDWSPLAITTTDLAVVTPDSPARAAFSQAEVSSTALLAAPVRVSPDTRAALELGASHTIVVGTDRCETDADCVPDGCHATSCVAAAEMAPGELACTAELRYGTTDGGGCLCQAGLCAARLSNPPQGI